MQTNKVWLINADCESVHILSNSVHIYEYTDVHTIMNILTIEDQKYSTLEEYSTN